LRNLRRLIYEYDKKRTKNHLISTNMTKKPGLGVGDFLFKQGQKKAPSGFGWSFNNIY